MPTVTPVTAGSVFNNARFFLNDTGASIYTDTALREPLNVAINDLRTELQDNDISVTSDTSAAIEILSGVTDIGGDTGPALPNDFLVPIQLWEKIANVDMDYLMMDKRDFLPKTWALTSFLQVWTYQNQIIKFLGANGNVDVKIDYRANRIFDVLNSNTQINVINAGSFLGFQTAGYAAEFIGENVGRAQSLYAKAADNLEKLMNLDIKNKQNQITRKRPFMAAYKSRGGYFR